MNPLLLLLACFAQDPRPASLPQQAERAPVAMPARPERRRLDRIVLQNGEELVGDITTELDGYVMIELGEGAAIGIRRATIDSIEHDVVELPDVGALVRPDSEWFVLHDADGAAVGWLHTSVTTSQDGSFAVNEEYEFQNGTRRYQITRQSRADVGGRGTSCYFRERVSRPKHANQLLGGADTTATAERIEDERIVEAKVAGDRLVVTRLDGDGKSSRELSWGEQATFPLLARLLARQGGVVVGPLTMFDPAHEQLVVRRFDGTGARQMVLDGEKCRVVEVAESGPDGVRGNREWLDANLATVRRELAGPALVAVPSSPESMRQAIGTSSIASAIVAEAEGRFGVWVPNPAWRTIAPLPPGHLQLVCDAHGAEVRVALLDHLDGDTVLETAADAVASWVVLLYPQLQVDSRYDVRVRGRRALRMAASDVRNTERATIDVVPYEDRFLVVICRAKGPAWDELADDFAFVRRTIELEREALTPVRQGPLAEDLERRLRPKAGPLPAPTPVLRIESRDAPAAGAGSVRIER